MQLEEMSAREAIREVVSRYFRAMDRVDDELGYSIFHDDGYGDYGPGIFAGPGRELIDWLNAYNRTLVTSHHQMSNCTIRVQGDKAASETYVTAALVRSDEAGYVLRRVYGRYIDRLSRRDGRWAIDHRFYRRDFYWEERVDGIFIGDSATRTPEDPSYRAFESLDVSA
jgi:hypothetical protein